MDQNAHGAGRRDLGDFEADFADSAVRWTLVPEARLNPN
jgi:hypothetical protein